MLCSLILLISIPLVLSSSVPSWLISHAEWEALNHTVGGRLHTATPMALPCFSSFEGRAVEPDPAACSIIQANYSNPEFLVLQPGSYMVSQWETCQTSSQECLLNSTNPYDPLAWTNRTCSEGAIPPYYIEVGGVHDVLAAYNFTRRTGVSLVIKTNGHDYKGRSSRKGALALWMHNITGLAYSEALVPDGCPPSISYTGATIAAGQTSGSVYDFAEQNNITIIGGYHQTIGQSGGWVMGGGHSVLSPVFGLGVDRVVQFKIVTPDGGFRTANECQNQDLFFALRGGGGGTFGVVMETTQVAIPRRVSLQVAAISFTSNGTDSQAGWLQLLAQNAYKWGLEGWGGHMTASSIINVNPLITLGQAQESVAELSAYAEAYNGSVTVKTLPSWYDFYVEYILDAEAGVGDEIALGTRLMPAALFQNSTGQQEILSVLTPLLPNSPYIVVGTPFLFNSSYGGGKTSTTPAWYTSLWHMGEPLAFAYNMTSSEVAAGYQTVHDWVDTFRAIAPDSGAYFNEGDVYETDHEIAYWGRDNHAKLLDAKHKYDPLNILDCWQCVGWSGPEDANYVCYPDISTASRL